MNSKKTTAKIHLAPPAFVAMLLLIVGGISAAPAFAATPTYGGSATVLSISSLLMSQTFGATGPLDSSGSWVSAPMSEVQTSMASADMLTASSLGLGQQAESEAATGNLVLLPGTAAEVDSDFAMAQANAACGGSYGTVQLGNLEVAGQSIPVTDLPNQTVSIPGVLNLVINEQIISGSGITINAIDLSTPDGTQIVVASASSSISCLSPVGLSSPPGGNLRVQPNHGAPGTPGCVDFTTGGGWIVPPAPFNGGKATFGFVAGYKNGGTNPRGELEYHDHTSGQFNVHSLDVEYYLCGQFSNSRVFGGDAELNHASGYCYEVFVQDNGEPGHGTDYFSIWLWNAADLGGDCTLPPSCGPACPAAIYANGNYLGGGNIEIHK